MRPMLRMPRVCGTAVNSPGTVFAASASHSGLSGVVTEARLTLWIWATKPWLG